MDVQKYGRKIFISKSYRLYLTRRVTDYIWQQELQTIFDSKSYRLFSTARITDYIWQQELQTIFDSKSYRLYSTARVTDYNAISIWRIRANILQDMIANNECSLELDIVFDAGNEIQSFVRMLYFISWGVSL